jgi:predicted AAA+ superfamily ATPase
MTSRPALERRLVSALDGSPSRIPFVVGPSGSGRTTLLHALHRQLGMRACQYVDVERAATTPERFYRAVISTSPFRSADARPIRTPRDAFDAILAFLTQARADGAPATFLLDEVLEFRTFESFPGLRGLAAQLFASLAQSENRFVLTTRYARRADRLLRDPGRFLLLRMPPLTDADVRESLGGGPRDRAAAGAPDAALHDTARVVQILADGHPAYVHDICEQMAALSRDGGDPISALTALLAHSGRLSARCNFCYELRLHRARGYGALKAILDILAQENGSLTLTEIAQRLHRTPGSTKDYLSWLEDVDLVTMNRKRYAFADPVLRLWVRLHCRPVPPLDEEVAREVQRYAMDRLAHATDALAVTA